MQRARLSIDIHPDLGKSQAKDEASTLGRDQITGQDG
jgi:hypothetical protein